MNITRQLENITLITVTTVDVDSAVNALVVSSEACKFGAVRLLSPTKPESLPDSIEHISIPPIDFLGYSKFMIEELYKFVNTKFCLVIQADGFVINPQLWRNEFFEYDYIGAPWPRVVALHNAKEDRFYFDKNRIGNGGFSLRSKRLLEVCSQIDFDRLNFSIKSEDLIICHFLYEDMLKAGIKFAPIDIAKSFSIESLTENLNTDLTSSFGFHGKHWLSNNYLKKLALKSNHPDEFSSLLEHSVSFSTSPAIQTILKKNIGRLDPCPCGSNMRFRDCHGKLA